jgi:DNA-binding transcriptional regulator YdaS (Cro superfamily)
MYKNQAIKMFGGQIPLAQALGITSSAISQWPDKLDQAKTDRVVGAAIRLKKPKKQIMSAARLPY